MIDRPDLALSAQLKAERRRPRRRWMWWLAGAGALSLLVSLVLTVYHGPGWLAGTLESSLRRGAGADGAVTAVVVGIDERAHDPGRTDTIMVVSLRVDDGRVGVISVPRDTRVMLPSGSFNKVNLMFTTYGPKALMDAVSRLLGVPVDGYVQVDFRAFEHVIDTLGGIEVTIPKPMRYVDRAQGLTIDLPAGRQVLDGQEALEFVRFRADGMGDVSFDPGTGEYFGRVQRQQQFVKALAEAMSQPRVLMRLPRLVRQVYGMVETDLPLDLALAAASWAMRRRHLEMEAAVLPGMPGTVAGASYWLPDVSEAHRMAARMLRAAVLSNGPVAVLNASGVGGSARRVAERLEEAGIQVVRVANARQFGLARSAVVVRDASGQELAGRVASVLHLQEAAPAERFSSWTGSEVNEPVVVLVGNDLAREVADSGAGAGGEATGTGGIRTAGRPRG